MSVWTEEDVLCSYTAYRKRKKARVLKQRLTIDRFPKRHSTPKRFWTPGMVDDLREMAARGMSYQQIADALGIKRTQVLQPMVKGVSRGDTSYSFSSVAEQMAQFVSSGDFLTDYRTQLNAYRKMR